MTATGATVKNGREKCYDDRAGEVAQNLAEAKSIDVIEFPEMIWQHRERVDGSAPMAGFAALEPR